MTAAASRLPLPSHQPSSPRQSNELARSSTVASFPSSIPSYARATKSSLPPSASQPNLSGIASGGTSAPSSSSLTRSSSSTQIPRPQTPSHPYARPSSRENSQKGHKRAASVIPGLPVGATNIKVSARAVKEAQQKAEQAKAEAEQQHKAKAQKKKSTKKRSSVAANGQNGLSLPTPTKVALQTPKSPRSSALSALAPTFEFQPRTSLSPQSVNAPVFSPPQPFAPQFEQHEEETPVAKEEDLAPEVNGTAFSDAGNASSESADSSLPEESSEVVASSGDLSPTEPSSPVEETRAPSPSFKELELEAADEQAQEVDIADEVEPEAVPVVEELPEEVKEVVEAEVATVEDDEVAEVTPVVEKEEQNPVEAEAQPVQEEVAPQVEAVEAEEQPATLAEPVVEVAAEVEPAEEDKVEVEEAVETPVEEEVQPEAARVEEAVEAVGDVEKGDLLDCVTDLIPEPVVAAVESVVDSLTGETETETEAAEEEIAAPAEVVEDEQKESILDAPEAVHEVPTPELVEEAEPAEEAVEVAEEVVVTPIEEQPKEVEVVESEASTPASEAATVVAEAVDVESSAPAESSSAPAEEAEASAPVESITAAVEASEITASIPTKRGNEDNSSDDEDDKPHKMQRSTSPTPSEFNAVQESEPPSLTLAILSAWNTSNWATRIPAVIASVAINFGLPFINGVMLGFGELFARNFIGVRFGWGSPFVAPGAEAGRSGRANTAGVGLRSAGSAPFGTKGPLGGGSGSRTALDEAVDAARQA